MSKVLFLNGNVHGHINPTLPIVKELVCRGEEVYYFSTYEFREKIESAGANFIDYGDDLNRFLSNFKPSGNHPFYTLIEFMFKMDNVIMPIVMKKTAGLKFDYLIHDSMFGAGKILSVKLGLPAICSCTSFAMNKLPMPQHMLLRGFHPKLDSLLDEIEEASEEWGIGDIGIMDVFFKKEDLNIVFTSRLFQPEAESFDYTYKFIGPSIAERSEKTSFSDKVIEGSKIIYISMGTINNNCLEFYHKCMEAFKDDESIKVVMSVGNKIDTTLLGEIPDNFIVDKYMPQIEVLKKTNLFISHGGLNSVSEAFYYGVPVIAIPQANDQPMVGKQITELGAGICLKMEEITPQLLKNMAIKVLSDKSFKMGSERIGKSFVDSGGYKEGVGLIFEFKKR